MIRDFISDFFKLVGGALTLNGEVLLVARDDPRAYLAAVLMAVLAGISLTLGQSVVLFANQVPPGRFAATLFAGSLAYTARLLLWSVSIWIVGIISPRYALPLGTTFLAVCFGQAPQLFSFFEMLPFMGSTLRRVLDAYSLIVVVAGLKAMLDIPALSGLFMAGVGWLLQAYLGGLLERPLAGVRGWMWRTASGRETFDRGAALAPSQPGTRPEGALPEPNPDATGTAGSIQSTTERAG